MKHLYCHPLFDERKCAHRFSFKLSKAFENNDLCLERFDYQGTGEADGAFCDITFDSLKDDLGAKIDSNTTCIVGTRLGAMVAFDYCSQIESNIQTLILIQPFLNGQNYVEYLFRKQHLKDIMTGNQSEKSDHKDFYNLEGYKTNSILIRQMKKLDLFERLTRNLPRKIFIIQISSSDKVNSEYKHFATHLRENGIHSAVEIFDLPVFWERIPDKDYSLLTCKIVEWCR